MEEIELFDNTAPLLPKDEPIIDYKTQIKLLYQKFMALSWIFQSEDSERVHLFTSDKFIKMECILHCDFSHATTLASDRSVYTREKWSSVKILTTLLEIDVNDGKMYLVNWERSLAIQWIRRTENHSLIIYSTCTHAQFRAGDPRPNQYMIRIQHLDRNKCFFTYIGMYKYEDIRKIEQVCMTNYHAIYDYWNCPSCRTSVPPHELECRRCKQARFARCVDKKCFREQREGKVTCEYCGQGVI